MTDRSRVSKYYMACGYTALRRGIGWLASMVTQQFGKELLENSLFLFCFYGIISAKRILYIHRRVFSPAYVGNRKRKADIIHPFMP